jgi:hypothetical protein
MPHAGPSQSEENSQAQGQQQQGFASGISAQAGKIADYARENPKTAAAAGAAIVGALAAAAIPLVRGRTGGSETSEKSSSTKSGSSNKNKQDA